MFECFFSEKIWEWKTLNLSWLVVWTPPKNMKLEWLSPIYGKISQSCSVRHHQSVSWIPPNRVNSPSPSRRWGPCPHGAFLSAGVRGVAQKHRDLMGKHKENHGKMVISWDLMGKYGKTIGTSSEHAGSSWDLMGFTLWVCQTTCCQTSYWKSLFIVSFPIENGENSWLC